jgi:hypothetical protein
MHRAHTVEWGNSEDDDAEDDDGKPSFWPSFTDFVPGVPGKWPTLAAQQYCVHHVLNHAIDHELLHVIFLKNSFPHDHERKSLLLDVLTEAAKAIGEVDVHQRLLSDIPYQDDMCRIVSFSLLLCLRTHLHQYCLRTLISSTLARDAVFNLP